jgi:hypothetical protein
LTGESWQFSDRQAIRERLTGAPSGQLNQITRSEIRGPAEEHERVGSSRSGASSARSPGMAQCRRPAMWPARSPWPPGPCIPRRRGGGTSIFPSRNVVCQIAAARISGAIAAGHQVPGSVGGQPDPRGAVGAGHATDADEQGSRRQPHRFGAVPGAHNDPPEAVIGLQAHHLRTHPRINIRDARQVIDEVLRHRCADIAAADEQRDRPRVPGEPDHRRGRIPPSPVPLPASLGLCRRHPTRCRGWRALLTKRPAPEQDAAHDRADGEDAGDPPERGVVAVRQRQPG